MKSSGEGRLNLTFRDVIGVLDETQFPKFRVSYNDTDYILLPFLSLLHILLKLFSLIVTTCGLT